MAGRPAISAVLFDMDGVLVDVSGSYRRAIVETVEYFTGRTAYSHTIQDYKDRGGFNDDWVLTHAIINDFGMEVSMNRVVDEFQRRYRGHEWDGFIANEPPLVRASLLEALKSAGRVLGIVTGRPEAEARWTLDRLGWSHFFPLVVAREHQGHRRKPDPFPLRHALEILRVAGLPITPKGAVYVGDSIDDMVAAKAAGLWAVGVVPPYLDAEKHAELLRSHGADRVTQAYESLPELITSLDREPG